MSDITFAIGEVAAMLGISPHTIRAWERRHLVVRPMRTASGQRRYTSDDVELLRQIKHERHVHGLSMRVATMTAQGLVVPDAGDTGTPAGTPPLTTDAAADPLRMVADLVPEVVVVVDSEGRIAHANTAFVRFSDVLLGQLRGQPFADFVDPFDRAKAVQAYQPPLRQRRGWELNLRVRRRRAFFSFDCWPIAAAEGAVLVLVGRDLSARPASPDLFDGVAAVPVPARPEAHSRSGMLPQLRPLLDGVADPVRTLGLVRRWLDATPIGVVLARADADLTVLLANRAFRRWVAPEQLPVEGRGWHAMWPGADADRLAAAAEEVIRTARPQTVAGCGPERASNGRAAGTSWACDVELCPVTEVGGGVTHFVFLVADVTAEVAAARRLDALVACTPALRHASDGRDVVRTAVRHAQDLLPNAGSLLAAVPNGSRETISVVAAAGVWSRADRGVDQELRLTLVRDVVRTRASIEVEWATGAEPVETLRIVPLLPQQPLPDGREALGALAFSRLGAGSFSVDDRQLIDEFAARLGAALGRAELLSLPRPGEPRLAV